MKHFNLSVQRTLKTIVLIFLLATTPALAQRFPIIKATATKVDIRDGNDFQKGIWNLSAEIKPDTYTVRSPFATRKVVFYTDIDSISFMITPGKTYDFIVLLNGKDSCFTRISALVPDPIVQVNPSALIPVSKLRNDFNLLREALEKVHPGLYTFRNKTEIDRMFQNNFALLKRNMNQLDFGKIIMRVLSEIKDGHTSSDLPRILVKHYETREKLFPVPLYLRDNKAYSVCDGLNGFRPGTEIISINGHKIPEIQNAMFVLLPGDGCITTKKRHIINEGAFSILYRYIYGNTKSFSVSYKTIQGIVKTTMFDADFFRNFPCEPRLETSPGADLEFKFLTDRTAILKIRSFALNRIGSKENFHKFLDSCFQKITSARVKNLILDVRENGGGEDDFGTMLYSYLTDSPFSYYNSLQRVDGRPNSKTHPGLAIQKPNAINFKESCYFLINGRTFSSAAEFCAVAKSNNRGIFIGEETGGGYYGNASGEQLELVLTSSGITVKIPKVKYTLAVKQTAHKNSGVLPDHPLVPTITDILSGRDAQLDFILKLTNSAPMK